MLHRTGHGCRQLTIVVDLMALQARNKTFDVCYEYEPDEGLQMYELVASIPGTGGAYLAPALSSLQKNT